MSADNWTICPKCKIKAETDRENQRLKISKAYGKVAPETYAAMCKAFDNPKPLEQTLREDYEQCMDDSGEYSCSYGCSCSVCHFAFTFSTKIEPETVFAQNKP